MTNLVARITFWLLLVNAGDAMGQGPDSIHAGGNDPNLPQPESKAAALSGGPQLSSQDSEAVKEREFAIPDVPKKLDQLTRYRGKYFSTLFGIAALADYNAFSQDSASIAQVGRQRDQWNDRSTRFVLLGTIGPESYQLHYLASYAWNGFDAPQNKKETWNFSDLIITAPVGKLGALTFGKNKEPFVYEMVGDAAFLPSLERVLNPFFTSRDVGLSMSNTAFKKRMTYSTGWFNDWWVHGKDFDSAGNHFASRVTGLISINDDGSRYLHVGASARYAGANLGVVRLQGKPESDVTSNYVDTGNIPASNQKEFALEALWTRDGYSVLTEYVRSQVNATQLANPSFYGFYITGSWFITGDHRPYDRNVGFARRPIPRHRWGAVELAARYSRLDLDNKSVHGGVMDKGLLDVNWFMNRRMKLGVSGGLAHLDRAGLSGFTEILQTRIQFVF
jgi:phosphate-selective porin OprO/OprP